MWSIQLASSSWLGYETVSFFAGRYFDSLQITAFGVVFGFPIFSYLSIIITNSFGFHSLAGYLLTTVFCSLSFLFFVYRKHKLFFFDLSTLQWWIYLTFGFLGFTLAHTTQMAGFKVSRNIPNFFDDFTSINLILNSKIQQSNVPLPSNQTRFVSNFLVASIIGIGETTIDNGLFIISFSCYLSLLVALYSLFYFISHDHFSSSISIILYYFLNSTYFSKPNWLCPIYLFNMSSLLALSLSIWSLLLYLISFRFKDIYSLIFAAFVHGLCSSLSFESFVSLFLYIFILLLIKKKSFYFMLISLSESISIAFVLYIFGFVKLNNIFRNFTFEVFYYVWPCFSCFGVICFLFGLFSISNEQLFYYLPTFITFLFKNSIFYYTIWIPISSSIVSLFLTYFYRRKQSKFGKYFSVLFSVLFVIITCLPTMCRYVDFLVNTQSVFTENEYRFGIWTLENTLPNSVFGRNINKLHDPLQVISCRKVHTLDLENINSFKDFNITHYVFYNSQNAFKPNKNDWKLIYSSDDIIVYRRL